MSKFASFKDLKKNRVALREKIATAIENDNKSNFNNEEEKNSWYPNKNDQGVASTLIRFLPPAHGQTLPWVKRYRHSFKENGKWLFENCPTTLGNDCPICTENKKLWQTEIKANRELASSRKRNLDYFYNIHVIDDTTQEDVTGTNKIFKSGPFIFKMIQGALNPEFDDEPKIDAFDMWEGADFNFKMFIKEKKLTYEKSSFKKPTEFGAGDEELQEKVYNDMFDLSGFIDPSKFNSYEEIEKNFNRVTGAVDNAAKIKSVESSIKEKVEEATDYETSEVEESDDALAMFEKMANS